MSVTKQRLSQLYKPCAAKGCSNPGIHEMEIVFLGRKGWFCEECKDGLMRDGLLLQQQAVDSILNNQTTKMGKGVSGDQPTDANPTQSTGHADTQQLRYDKEVIVS